LTAKVIVYFATPRLCQLHYDIFSGLGFTPLLSQPEERPSLMPLPSTQ
jgi:hypothetical protein